MFNILAMCDDYILGNIISIIKRTIDLLGIIVPILLIIGGTINIVKGVFNPEDKKVMSRIVTCFASAIIVFFLPVIINTTMAILSYANDKNTTIGINNQTFSVSTCWNNIKKVKTSTEIKKSENKVVVPTIIKEKEMSIGSFAARLLEALQEEERKGSVEVKLNSSNSTSKTFNEVVLIGDSRFAGSNQWYHIGNDKTVYIASGGTGLQYIKDQMDNIKKHDNANTAFVINSGINDRGIVNSYISYLNEQAKTFKGKLYYLSVNPVEESKQKGSPYYTTNQEVNTFNEKMKAGLDSNYITYLDSNSYLKANGYNTTDGIHYDKETSQKIYDYITKYVKS